MVKLFYRIEIYPRVNIGKGVIFFNPKKGKLILTNNKKFVIGLI